MNDEYDVNVNIRDDPAVDVQTDSAPDVNVNSDGEILIDAEVSPDIDIDAESDDEEQLDVSIDESLGGSVADHRRLSHRDEPRQHPISAIDGLSDRLATIQNAIDTGFIDASEAISVVAVAASGKNTVFHSSTEPTEQGTGQEFKVGDTWFNSTENYCMYTWNGTQWVREQFGNAAFAHASIWEANIQNGAITTAKIADAAITNAKIDSLDVSKLTGGYIDAEHIDASELVVDAAQITGTLTADQIAVNDIIANYNLVVGDFYVTQTPYGAQLVVGSTTADIYDGATGATGPQGPQGATGPQGPQGPQGPTGPSGTQAYITTISGRSGICVHDAYTYTDYLNIYSGGIGIYVNSALTFTMSHYQSSGDWISRIYSSDIFYVQSGDILHLKGDEIHVGDIVTDGNYFWSTAIRKSDYAGHGNAVDFYNITSGDGRGATIQYARSQSDRRLKDDISYLNESPDKYIDFYKNLRPTRYKYKHGVKDDADAIRYKYGFIAQDIEDIAEQVSLTDCEMAYESDVIPGTEMEDIVGKTYKSLDYESFHALHVLYGHYLEGRISALEQRLASA